MEHETRLHFLTLGCDKNRVDGEVMQGFLCEAGYTVTSDAAAADIIVVNTCGFIRDAVQEGIETILTLAEHKRTGACRGLIVAGCMAQRYKDEILAEIPEVDAVLPIGDFSGLVEAARMLVMPGEPQEDLSTATTTDDDFYERRFLSKTAYVAYVKIAEGCDNRCAYCAIPQIRGPYRSRVFEHIIDECRGLVERGARELVLVAQDTARYGIERYGRPRLHELLQMIADIDGLAWVRVMYAYPEHITPELIAVISEHPKVCQYLDMPIQHSHDAVLKRMGRHSTNAGLRSVIEALRVQAPGIALRTTLMTGFPGETAEEFNALCEFVREIRFDRLGVFAYSKEEGTPAAHMKQQVKSAEKRARRDTLMRLQQEIHQEKQRALVGQTVTVIVDATADENGRPVYTGRSYRDAPDVDAVVYFTAHAILNPGDLVAVHITGHDEYDLQGVLADESTQ